jgi:CRP/FNR family cyclic AMP-dependent transcriptional regulator
MSNILKIDERMAELNPGIPLPSEILDRLLAAGRKLRFEKGQTIHIAGDLTASLSIIIEGEVGFGRVSQEGRNIPASILTAGQSFGELPLFAGVSRTHDATAMTEVVLADISKARLDRLMVSEPVLRDYFISSLARTLLHSLDLLDDERRLPIVVRVAKQLDERCQQSDCCYVVRRNQSQIADDLGVHRSSVVSAFAELAQEGLIEPRYRGATIPDILNLRNWIALQSR